MSIKNTPVFYTVCLSPFDSIRRLQDPLANARKEFFENGKKRIRVQCQDNDCGLKNRCRGTLCANSFQWQKKLEGKITEESSVHGKNHLLLIRSSTGRLISRITYSNQKWVRTAYFDISNEHQPIIVLQPAESEHGIIRLDYQKDSGKYRPSFLYPCPIEMQSARQSVINFHAGEPKLIASTSLGFFCYCSKAEQTMRAQLSKQVDGGELSLIPSWNLPSINLTDENEKKLPASPEKPEPPNDLFRLFTPVMSNASAAGVLSETKNTKKEHPLPASEPDKSEHSKNQLVPSAPQGSSPCDHTVSPKPSNPEPYPINREVSAPGAPSQTPHPARYCVAAKKSRGPIRIDHDHIVIRENTNQIVVSAEESYLDFGSLLKNLQDEQSSKSEITVTAFKDGRPSQKSVEPFSCENQLFKSGFGIACRSKNGTLFVGKWHNNEPSGEGSAFDLKGNLIYTGMWKNGLREGHGTEFDSNGRVVFTGEWQNDSYFNGLLYQTSENHKKGEPI